MRFITTVLLIDLFVAFHPIPCVGHNRVDVVLVIDMVNRDTSGTRTLSSTVINDGLLAFLNALVDKADIGDKADQIRMAVFSVQEKDNALVSLNDGRNKQQIKSAVAILGDMKEQSTNANFFPPNQIYNKVKGLIVGADGDRPEAPNVVIMVAVLPEKMGESRTDYDTAAEQHMNQFEPRDLMVVAGEYGLKGKMALIGGAMKKNRPSVVSDAMADDLLAVLSDTLSLCASDRNDSQCYFDSYKRCVYESTFNITQRPSTSTAFSGSDLDRYCLQGTGQPEPCPSNQTDCQTQCAACDESCRANISISGSTVNRFYANCPPPTTTTYVTLTLESNTTDNSSIQTTGTRTKSNQIPLWAVALLTGGVFIFIVALAIPVVLLIALCVRTERENRSRQMSIRGKVMMQSPIDQKSQTHVPQYFDPRNRSARDASQTNEMKSSASPKPIWTKEKSNFHPSKSENFDRIPGEWSKKPK